MDEKKPSYYNPETGVRGETESNPMVLVGCLVFILALLVIVGTVIVLVAAA